MSYIITSDGTKVKLPQGFDNRWELLKNIREEVGLDAPLPVNFTSSEVSKFLSFDRDMIAGKVKVCGKLSELNGIISFFDPYDDEWMLYIEIDENVTNRAEYYIRLGHRLRTVWIRNYVSERFTLMSPDDPLVAFDMATEKDENGEPYMRHDLDSDDDNDRRCVLPTINHLLELDDELDREFSHIAGCLYSLRLTGTIAEFAWKDYMESKKNGSHREAYRHSKMTDGYENFLRLFPRDTVIVRNRIEDAMAGIYEQIYNYTDSDDEVYIILKCAPAGVSRMDSRKVPLLRQSYGNPFFGTYHHAVSDEWVSVPLLRQSYGNPFFGTYHHYAVSDDEVLRKIALHNLKTRDPYLDPAKVGLGHITGTMLFWQYLEVEHQEEVDEKAIKGTKMKKPKLTELSHFSAASMWLSHNIVSSKSLEELIAKIGEDIAMEVASALLDWLSVLQEKYSAEESIDAGEPDFDEVAALIEEWKEPLPDSLFNRQLEKPIGNVEVHSDLYEDDEDYAKVYDYLELLLAQFS
jgi:hypothetical protein